MKNKHNVLEPLLTNKLLDIGEVTNIAGQDGTILEKNYPSLGKSLYKKNILSAKNTKNKSSYKTINNQYGQLSKPQRQLADFTIKQLLDLPNKSDKYGTLDKLNLLNRPYRDKNNQKQDFYYEDKINLASHGIQENPLVTLIHEGHHALDDLWMRTHQKEAIDYLAKQEAKATRINKAPIAFDLRKILTDAQTIVNHQKGFSLYPYDYFHKKIYGDNTVNPPQEGYFETLSKDKNGNPTSNPVTDFRTAKQVLDTDRTNGADSGGAFLALSEFPAHMLENIGNPLNVNNTNHDTKQGRKFLYNIIKGTYDRYIRSGLNDKKYANVMQSFKDRLTQLNPSSQGALITIKRQRNLSKNSALTKKPKFSTGGNVTRARQQQSNFDMERAIQILEMLSRGMV